MRVVDYYRYISDSNFNLSEERDRLESYLLAGGQKDYQLVADTCRKLGLRGVVDLGCSYGFQSEIFQEKRLKYHGIDNGCIHFWNGGGENITFQAEEYPCYVNVETRNMLAVSRFCVGYTMKDYEKLAKDFSCILVDKNGEAYYGLSRYFTYVSDLSAIHENSVPYSLFVRNKKEAEQFKRKLKSRDEHPKFHVCGLQFPGEEGITASRVMDLFDMTKGYYYDLIRIEGQNSAAYVVMDSNLYVTWENDGLYERFIRFVKEILDDVEKETGDGIYDFCGYRVYLGYM